MPDASVLNAFAGRLQARSLTLDALCDVFGVIPHGRRTATRDAFLTAQIFLWLRRLALKHGRDKLAQICEPFEED
jgi:hypothetical protein